MRLRAKQLSARTRSAATGPAAAAPFLLLQAAPAHAGSMVLGGFDPLIGFLTVASLTVCGWAFTTVRRLSKSDHRNRLKVSELEYKLNESEAALAAEAQLMIVWHGKEALPGRIINTMRGAARIPEASEELTNFSNWLEPDSAAIIGGSLATLRERGRPFNVGIRTKHNELLEADGRVAGSMATLKFRPLSGERQQITELNYDARKLGLQVERLSAILDSAPLPIWLRNSDGTLAWVNNAYVKALEVDASDMVLKSGIEIAPQEKIDRDRADPKSALLGRAHTVLSGAMRALNIHEVKLNEGRAGYAIDVSDLEHAEKELDRLLKAHASTLDKLDTAIAIFGPDQRLRFHNTAYAQLWPLDSKWLEARPTDGEILDRLRSQRCIPEQANYREWRSKQLSSYTTLEVRENWWYLPDGRSLHVVCEQHPFGGVTYLYQNVTKTLQLESRYNELIDVQRETLDNLDEAIALFGSDGRLKLFNPPFRLFWNLEETLLASEPHIDQIAFASKLRGDGATLWHELKYAITGLDADRQPMRGRLHAGERILAYSFAPLPDGNGLLTFSDISDPAKMEKALRERAEALEAADQLKNTFLGNISYEIRTPLTSILGFAETLSLGIAGTLSEKQSEYVADIKRSSEDLKSIIDAIIDLSAIDAGAMELRLGDVKVLEVAEAAAQRLDEELAKRDQTLSIELSDEAIHFVGDNERVQQVIGNLLSNAIGFSPNGSTIRLGAKYAGDKVQIWVADNGRGIDPEFQPKAFDRFQSKPMPGSHRGAGLGLPVVKSFTELHGGQVMLVSKPGLGTTVVCAFPRQGPAVPDHKTQRTTVDPQRAA